MAESDIAPLYPARPYDCPRLWAVGSVDGLQQVDQPDLSLV